MPEFLDNLDLEERYVIYFSPCKSKADNKRWFVRPFVDALNGYCMNATAQHFETLQMFCKWYDYIHVVRYYRHVFQLINLVVVLAGQTQ